ncbi:MAG TPA: alpha/beta hydrolase [Polyangiaceae bacterium]|nr:alpha/beta hydrolase [Polyangiaceae bacterium]
MTFVLHHASVGNEQAPHVALVLHGVFGSGSNFRSLMKSLAAERHDWRFVLVDLRLHGRSLEARPPHSLAACADDLAELTRVLALSPAAVIGHSFGGKVALTYAERRPVGLSQVWVLDSYPGAHRPAADHEVIRVLRSLEAVGRDFESREAFVDALLERSLTPGISQWLSQNLVREGERYWFRLDLRAIGELLDDYFQRDLWPVVEHPPPNVEVHLVVAERSRRLNDEARTRLSARADQRQVHRYTLPDAGHWLHVDNPNGLIALLRGGLSR